MPSTEKVTNPHRSQKWQEAIWLFVVLLIPLFVNLWVEQQFEASKIWLLRPLIWLLALWWTADWLAGDRPRSLPNPIPTLMGALTLVLILATALSANQTVAVFGSLERANGVLTQLSYLLLFVCVATRIGRSESQLLLRILLLPAVPIGLIALAQAAGWDPLSVLTDGRSPLTTTLGRANFTGAYLAMLLPLTATAARTASGRWPRRGWIALFVLQLVVVFLTRARAAWIGGAAGLGVLLWLELAPGWSRRGRWLTALVAGGAAAVGLIVLLQRSLISGGSIAARWTIWRGSLRLLWPRLWLGYGADTLELYFPAVYPPELVYYQGRGVVVDRAHNWLLDGSLSYGVVATALLVALIFVMMRLGWRQLAFPADLSPWAAADRRWLAGCMAAVSANLIGNLFLFEVAATALVFWLLLAVIVSLAAAHDGRLPVLNIAVRGRTTALIGGLILLGWGMWVSSVRPLLADGHSWRGTQALSRGDLPQALRSYEAAVIRQPKQAAYHVAVGLTAAQLGRFEQAELALSEALHLRPTDPQLYAHLGELYGVQGVQGGDPAKVQQAYGTFDRAVILAPTVSLIYQQYADVALRAGDWETAVRQAQKAVDLDATAGVSYGVLGWAQLQLGDLQAAQEAFVEAVRWEPASADFFLGLATAYALQGRMEDARPALQMSLGLDPAYAPALALQEQLEGN